MRLYGLKNMAIFLRAVAGFIFAPKNRGYKKTPRKVVVVQLAKLGDMVCATPIFRAIKKQYPDCRVLVAGNKTNSRILKDNPDVDLYIEFGGDINDAAMAIKKELPDVGFVTTPSFASLAMLLMAGVKEVIVPIVAEGFCPQQTLLYKILSIFARKIRYKYGQYMPGLYLKLLEPIGIHTVDTIKHLGFSTAASHQVSHFLTDAGIIAGDFVIGISPSSGNKIKNWGSNKFAELAKFIYEKYNAKIVILGGQNDRREVLEMLAFLEKNKVPVIDTLDKFNLDELKAVISKMDMLIAVDTGPVYIAEAFGVPTIDIVGPIDEREQPPVGEFHKIVKLGGKEPQLHILNTRIYDEKEVRRQIDGIGVDMVAKSFEELFELVKMRRSNQPSGGVK